jgi:hypothetical protein
VKTHPNKRLTPWSYLATILTVHLVFIILNLTSVFKLPFAKVFAVQLASVLLMLLSAGILFIKNNGDALAQTFRFLILMVTQMLGYLSISLALIYTEQELALVLYLLGLSMSILAIQTSYLVRRLK